MNRRILSLVILLTVFTALFIPLLTLTSFAAEKSATLSFADKAQRTSFSTSKQVWEQNGITFTNNKSSSTNNVADYANPVRLYAKSSVTVEAPGNITKIVFDCNSSSYATAMKNSAGGSATASSDKVTVTLDGTSATYTIASLTAQVRLDSLTVTYTEADGACEHTNTKKTVTKDATCTETGLITVTCLDCDEEIEQRSTPALGHKYVDNECTVCHATIKSANLISNISGINIGDEIIIVAKDYNVALSTNQANNNRSETDVTKENDNATVLFDDNVQILTVTKGLVEGTFALYAGNGYLYAASSDSNYLRTETELSENSSWTITITDGVASLTASGTNTRNALQYNANNKIFSCYVNDSQKEIALYKVNTGCKHTDTEIYIENATCDESGYKAVICVDCKATVSSEELPSLGHDIVDGICSRCGYTEQYTPPSSTPTASGWTLVTDASTLKAGDKIIIVAMNTSKGSFIAGDISSSVMSSKAITDSTFAQLPSEGIELTLGGSEGTWTLTNSSGKLLGCTTTKKLAWGSGTTTWSISIDSKGNATIESTTASYGRFLYNVSSPRFTTYTSNTNDSMLLPQIYKFEENSSGTTEDVSIYGASMTVGSTLAMNYYVAGCIGSNYYMTFTVNGTVSEPVTGINQYGYLMFTFDNIPPHMMSETISAMVYDGEGNALLDEAFEFSVKEYATKVLSLYGNDEKLSNLVADMLKYGAAAQRYKNFALNSLATTDIDLTDKGNTSTPTNTDDARTNVIEADTGIDKNVYAFTATGVRFDFDNKIYVKFKTDDISKIKLTCNGKNVTASIEAGEGIYVFYTDGISATEFDKVFTFQLYVDDVLCQTITYSVNSYAYAKYDGQTDGISDLVIALYRYGLSAKEYAGW